MNRFSNFAVMVSLPLAFLSGCMSPPKDLDTSLTRHTVQEKYVLTLVPPAETPPINAIHSWKVQVATPGGEPVTSARVLVDGGMPQHGHGLPTQPVVRREPSPGTYVIEGMKFSMTGWWEIKLKVQAAGGEDAVTFNTVVKAPGSAN